MEQIVISLSKTLALTYLAWRNYRKGLKVYSNYELKLPYTPIKTVKDILGMKDGFFAGDELWSWIDCRASMQKKNMVVGNFLLTSRKRDVNFAFTAQSFQQIDIRIRRVCDFLAVPHLTVDEKICRLLIFSYPSLSPIRTYKFRTQPIFDLYDTREVVDALPDEDEDMDEVRKQEKKGKSFKFKDLDDLEQMQDVDLDEDD